MSFIPFADATHASLAKIPASKTMPLIALYATGSSTIEATAADIAKYRAAGTGVILIDQTASLAVFAAGLADVADVEKGAGTLASVASAIAARQRHGWQSTVYVSQSGVPNVEAALPAGTDKSLVLYGVANWSDSQSSAEAAMNANPRWAYVQYGDPAANPNTLVPGTSVSLRTANADINVAQATWANQFVTPAPGPGPLPPKVGTGYRWVADGTQSLEQVAAARGAEVIGLVQVSAENVNTKNRDALNAYIVGGVNAPMPKGLVYYTQNA